MATSSLCHGEKQESQKEDLKILFPEVRKIPAEQELEREL